MLEQPFEFYHFQGFFVGGLQDDRGCNPMLISLPPPAGTQTPPVPRVKSREIVVRYGGAQVISPGSCKMEKFSGHDGTYHMGASVIRACAAPSIPVETGKGFITTTQKTISQDILFFIHMLFL